MEIGESRGFGTDVTEAERVVLVAPDRPDVFAVCVDENAARCFAQRAGRGLHHAVILRAKQE